jgi:ribosomal protein S18 acetylase RimI-like enzyme
MKLITHKLSEDQAKELSNWVYDGEYSIYNLPAWDSMIVDNYSLCDEVKRERYIGYSNESQELVGFVNLLDQKDNVFFGIGINPIYCGRGLGKLITKKALLECDKRFPKKPVLLEVRTWNQRAINCYKSQGFEIIDTKQQVTHIGFGQFYVMRYLSKAL